MGERELVGYLLAKNQLCNNQMEVERDEWRDKVVALTTNETRLIAQIRSLQEEVRRLKTVEETLRSLLKQDQIIKSII
jgi:uncharacterized protein YlxW (UPF0749 family)